MSSLWAYGIAVALLLVTLAVGTGAGTAAGSKSWLSVGGHRFGQPAELAKLAVILMLARWLAGLREAPSTLRDLIMPAAITGLPCFLVLKQPDLGSAIVFVAILFFMLFWAGTKPSLLLLAASPVIGLGLAFSTVAWGVWIGVLALLLLWWRPYVWEGLAIMVLNVLGGVWRRPYGCLAPISKTPARVPNPDIDPGCRQHVGPNVAVGQVVCSEKGFTEGTRSDWPSPAQHTDFIFWSGRAWVSRRARRASVARTAPLCAVADRRRATDQFSSLCVFGIAGSFSPTSSKTSA